MAITAKELMTAPRFEVFGSFVRAYPPNGDWEASFEFNCLGGSGGVRITVDDGDVINPPAKDSLFHIVGIMRMSSRNGAVSLLPESRRLVADLSTVPIETLAAGLVVKGVGRVVRKVQTTMNRQTFLSAEISWCGGQRNFKQLSPELFQKISKESTYGRFSFGVVSGAERNATGQTVVYQFPQLMSWEQDTLQGVSASSSPSAAKPLAAGVKPGVSPVAS
ncbi:MAG: hypothetical protein LBH00_10550 [Planctomycetaceae bacterium]|jgi:hypothetical protein|nr:hypothetical protein [Planctomycetaceae bacterium]